MGIEQRRHKRIPSDLLVRATVAGHGGEHEGTCRNLSRSGAFIEMKSPPQPGEPLRLLLELEPIGRSIAVSAVVVWARPAMPDKQFPPGVGVRFTKLDGKARRYLDEALRALAGLERKG